MVKDPFSLQVTGRKSEDFRVVNMQTGLKIRSFPTGPRNQIKERMIKMSRKKTPSPKRQVQTALKKQTRFGESKYQAKLDRAPDERAPRGIFSFGTHDTYVDQGETFLKWARVEHGEKYLDGAEQYAPEYIQILVDKKHSAWTIQLGRAALRKIYENQDLAKDVQLPERKKMDITRSRGPKPSDVNFSITKNQGLVDFSKATGLRRMELKAVRVDQIQANPDGSVFITGIHGKGGRERESPVLAGREKAILDARDKALARGDLKVWPKVPQHMDVHGYRREYAQALYDVPLVKTKTFSFLVNQIFPFRMC